jgi:hypothetical protein
MLVLIHVETTGDDVGGSFVDVGRVRYPGLLGQKSGPELRLAQILLNLCKLRFLLYRTRDGG